LSASFNTSITKSVSITLDIFQDNTALEYQSIIATRETIPPLILI